MEGKERYKRFVDNGCMPCGYNAPCDSFYFSETVINILLDKINQKDKHIKSLEAKLKRIEEINLYNKDLATTSLKENQIQKIKE